MLILNLALCLSTAPPQDIDARALFLEHCATCHGELGDGQGVTVLPRPARSFLDGGFSYGNTRHAIGRTLEHGIPGTPMPSFAEALRPEQRAALVSYVIGLGPQRKQTTPAETILEVTNRAQVVRGFLPALATGAPEWPRGLLIGLTSGTTFQYRADDVRLLAVRQGDFVERRDWGGRGGNPLRPLGQVTHLVGEGRAPAPWADGAGELKAQLTSTFVYGETAGLTYTLQRDRRPLVRVSETPRILRTSAGAGFARTFELEAVGDARELELRWPAPGSKDAQRDIYQNPFGEQTFFEWVYHYRGPDGSHELLAIVGPDDTGFDPRVAGLDDDSTISARGCGLRLPARGSRTVELYRVTLIDGTAETRERFLREMYR
jgi:Cytochrome c